MVEEAIQGEAKPAETTGAAAIGLPEAEIAALEAAAAAGFPPKVVFETIDFAATNLDELAAAALVEKAAQEARAAIALEGRSELTPAVAAGFEQLVGIIAKLTARVAALEARLDVGQRSRTAATALDPLQVEDRCRLALTDLPAEPVRHFSVGEVQMGRNWYPPEDADGSCMWSGPGRHSTLLIPAIGIGEGRITVHLQAIKGQKLASFVNDLGVAFFLDDQRLEPHWNAEAESTRSGSFEAPFRRTHGDVGSHFVLHIYSERVVRPSELIAGSRNTKLMGVGLRGVTLTQAGHQG